MKGEELIKSIYIPWFSYLKLSATEFEIFGPPYGWVQANVKLMFENGKS